jgi:hypothetical protein
MLDDTRAEIPGLPDVVLIDFGNAEIPPEDDSIARDWSKFCHFLYILTVAQQACVVGTQVANGRENYINTRHADRQYPCNHSEEWKEFHKALRPSRVLSETGSGSYISEEKFLQKFHPVLDEKRKGIDEETQRRIKTMIETTRERERKDARDFSAHDLRFLI